VPRLRRAAGAGSDSWRHSHPLSQGIRRFAIVELQLGRHSQRVDKWWLYILIYVLTMCWQYVDSMSLPLCPCLWRLWFSRIMIWKFNGAGSGAVFLWRAKLNPKKRIGPHLPRRARWPWFRLLRLLRWLCMLVDTWNMLKPDGCIKLNMMIHTYVHTYIYISLIGGKALGWNKRRNRCLANSNIDHLDPVWTLGFQNLFKLLSKQAGWQLLHHKKQLYLYVYTVYMYVLYYYIVI
jgi:uncharacterized membrane protein